MVSHGHVLINGKRTTSPSYRIKVGDVLTVRTGSQRSPLFAGLAEEQNQRSVAKWIETDFNLMRTEIKGEPSYDVAEAGLDYATVFEFYSR
jgi:small subunit ribosomal protein S4